MLDSWNELSIAGLSEQQLRGQHFKIRGSPLLFKVGTFYFT